MYIFINPWASYNPDDIPSLLTGDSEIDNKTMWAVIYSVILTCLFIIGTFFFIDFLVTLSSKSMLLWVIGLFGYLGTYIGLIIYGINKIFGNKHKKKCI